MITKHQAALLWANNYRLVDKEGKVFGIHLITENTIGIYGSKVGDDKYVKFEKIGIDYFILCRPLSDLTTEITHEGKKFVPVVSLGFPNTKEVFDSFKHVIEYNYIPSSEKEKLYSWHFNIGFPEEAVKPLK